MLDLLKRLEEGKIRDGDIIVEGQMRWKVFNVWDKAVSKKRLFKYLTDKEPKGAEWLGLKEKTLEIDPPEKLSNFMASGFSGYHCLFRCYGSMEDPDGMGPPEEYKAWGYIFSGVRTTSKGIEISSWVYVSI